MGLMKLIVGLGNPGEKYQKTRHNIGFWVVEALLRKLAPLKKTTWQEKKNLQAEIARVGNLVIAKPTTMMNSSGTSVQKLKIRFKPSQEELWLIHDDIDLPLGKIKIVQGRGAAGHRGVESIVRTFGNQDFARFRLGVGRPFQATKSKAEVTEFVVSEFDSKEKTEAKKMVKKKRRGSTSRVIIIVPYIIISHGRYPPDPQFAFDFSFTFN